MQVFKSISVLFVVFALVPLVRGQTVTNEPSLNLAVDLRPFRLNI